VDFALNHHFWIEFILKIVLKMKFFFGLIGLFFIGSNLIVFVNGDSSDLTLEERTRKMQLELEKGKMIVLFYLENL
jgi:hypothetical protein